MALLTAAQARMVEAIKAFKEANGYAPTVRDLRDALGIASPSTVHHHLANLERLGVVSREPNKPRTITVVNQQEKTDAAPMEDQPATAG